MQMQQEITGYHKQTEGPFSFVPAFRVLREKDRTRGMRGPNRTGSSIDPRPLASLSPTLSLRERELKERELKERE